MLPPIVRLAISAVPGERKFVCFAGAGLSKDAGLPTAWDLMMQAVQLLRNALGDTDTAVPDERWFLDGPYSKMSYAELIGQVYATSPDQQDFAAKHLGGREPGAAHVGVAQLAAQGVLRCVITTNFDDLIERAIRAAGLSCQVIVTDEDLATSEPLAHCKHVRVYKPHGTLGVGQLRNTPRDLERLSLGMEEELTRVVQDHGLLAVGYAGQDPGILRVFQNRRRHPYPAFWVNPVPPPQPVEDAFSQNGGAVTHLACSGAGAFFGDLQATYGRLAAMAPAPVPLAAEADAAVAAIEGAKPNVAATVRRFMEAAVRELQVLAPTGADPEWNDRFTAALNETIPIALQFCRIAQSIAEHGHQAGAVALARSFGTLVEKYNNPRGFTGQWHTSDFDLFKFIGHEFMTMYVAMLLREDQVELVGLVVQQQIYVDNAPGQAPDLLQFAAVSDVCQGLGATSERTGRPSVHADHLRKRHTSAQLAANVPIAAFVAADWLMSAIAYSPENAYSGWWPWSAYCFQEMGGQPWWLVACRERNFAVRLRKCFVRSGAVALGEVLSKHSEFMKKAFPRFFFPPQLMAADLAAIGTRG